jgi:glucosamine--fructose-6-phosphate aminotransferase (isomerizing)
MNRGEYTRQEILTQPEAWADALDQVDRLHKPLSELLASQAFEQVLFTGCGSTYYLSQAAAALFQELTGRTARAVPGSELLLNTSTVLSTGKTLLVAVSRSGSTTETVRAVEQFKANQAGAVIAITNYGDQPLAALGDLAVVIEKGQEHSVAQTRSFASMYVAATALAALAGRRADLSSALRGLPEAGLTLLPRFAEQAQLTGENLAVDRFYFLGSGARYGLACEVNLKMKEMTLTHSEPFHFLEFRHGPMSMVTPATVMVGLVSEKNAVHEMAVLGEMQSKGAAVLSLGESGCAFSFDSRLPEAVRGVLYLPALQWMGYARSMAKGLNPDQPENLTAVVKLAL